MLVLLLIGVVRVGLGLAENSTHSRKGEIRAVDMNRVNTFVYRPYTYQYGPSSRHFFNSSSPRAYIMYFHGESEQDVRDRYSSAFRDAIRQRMFRYKKAKLYGLPYPTEEVLSGRWYGYNAKIYLDGQLIYEDAQVFYQTPMNLERCIMDDFVSNLRGTPCSEIFLDPKDRPTTSTQRLPSFPRTRYTKPDTNVGIEYAVGIPLSAVDVTAILLFITCCCCCCSKADPQAVEENESNTPEQTTTVGNRDQDRNAENPSLAESTNSFIAIRALTLTAPHRASASPEPAIVDNDAPPSYYEVVGRKIEITTF